MNKSQKSGLEIYSNSSRIHTPSKQKFEKNTIEIKFQQKKKLPNNSNISLDKFENKTKKGIKFGLLEYKRLNEIKNFDICNGKFILYYIKSF